MSEIKITKKIVDECYEEIIRRDLNISDEKEEKVILVPPSTFDALQKLLSGK